MENYERKYKKALEWMQSLYSDLHGAAKEDAEHYFPELKEKESEGEKIRQEIRNFIWGYPDKLPERDRWLAWFEKQGENKHTDKVEPKFKVGDWITDGDYIWKIVEVTPLDYILQSQDGDIVDDTISYVDEQFHSFTIEDAKDGDVLVVNNIVNNKVFIYAHRKQMYSIAVAHCFVDSAGDFYLDGEFGYIENGNLISLATKEQRDLLFQKMKEAGYEWDTDKKELKKIEPKKVNANKVVIEWINANKVIEWLKNTIKASAENYGVFKATHLTLPYNSIEDLINDFKEDFGL